MAPAQALPTADEDPTSKAAIRPSSEKANGDCTETREAVDLTCANNCEDNAFYAEPPSEHRKVEDAEEQEVDVLGCEGGGALQSVKDEDPDATEHSSSFGGTFSGSGDGSKLEPGEMEVESKFYVDNGYSSGLDGCSRVFKKKKVTDNWRRSVRPLSWRCQWLELQMKELRSQALIYDKELEAYKHEKLLQTKIVELDDSASRLVPLTCQSHRKRAMRRQKRKRNEDTVDISSYMSNHNIFSYYENKRPETDCHSIDDDCDDQVDENINHDLEWSLLRLRRRDSSLEQILVDIESVLSRVAKLKSLLNEVMCRNSSEISSTPDNILPGDPLAYCARSLSFSHGNDGDAMQVDVLNSPTHHLSEYEMEDMIMPGSVVSSYGDACDMEFIESTMGLFSAADIPLDQHDLENLCEDIDDDVLIDNQAAEDKLQDYEVSHVMEKPRVTVKEEAVSSEEASTAKKVSARDPSPEAEKAETPQQPLLKPCYSGKRRGRKPKKRRRGGFAAGSSRGKNQRVQKQ